MLKSRHLLSAEHDAPAAVPTTVGSTKFHPHHGRTEAPKSGLGILESAIFQANHADIQVVDRGNCVHHVLVRELALHEHL